MENQPIPPDHFDNISKKKRVSKRFTSKEQIIAKIDKFQKKAKQQRENQREAYSAAGRIRRSAHDSGDATLLPEAVKKDALGDKWGLKADRLEREVLENLKRKLAEFNTMTIPGLTTDESVSGI